MSTQYQFFKKVALVTMLVLPALASAKIVLTDEQTADIGQKIWQNEGLGRVDYLTVWNEGEDFPSFGIGHFIWYPQGVNGPFVASFPVLRDYLAMHMKLPGWLAEAKYSPWQSREDFYQQFDSLKMRELRLLLEQSVSLQVEVIVQRMEAALPKMLRAAVGSDLRVYLEQQFYKVAAEPSGPYALVDYINFKGEGVALRERYQGEGWGLLQVLMNMDPQANDVMAEYIRSADAVLTQRVSNAPRDESRWLLGWRKRLQSYSELP